MRSPDERLVLVARSYGRAMCELAGTPDPEGHALLQETLVGLNPSSAGEEDRRGGGHGREGKAVVGEQRDGSGGGNRGSGELGDKEGQKNERERGTGGDDLVALMDRTRCGG